MKKNPFYLIALILALIGCQTNPSTNDAVVEDVDNISRNSLFDSHEDSFIQVLMLIDHIQYVDYVYSFDVNMEQANELGVSEFIYRQQSDVLAERNKRTQDELSRGIKPVYVKNPESMVEIYLRTKDMTPEERINAWKENSKKYLDKVPKERRQSVQASLKRIEEAANTQIEAEKNTDKK